MDAALGWGAVAASSLVIGAGLAFARRWPAWQVGLVLAFGAGALISAVSFELAAEGLAVGSLGATAGGLAVGALTYYVLDGLIARHFSAGRGRTGRASASDPGIALALGAFLDGIPEQLVLGIGLAGGEGIGIGPPGHADRLDDPRGDPGFRPGRWAGHDPRLRRGDRALERLLELLSAERQ